MASPVLTPQGINDLVATTLRDLGGPKFTEITTDLQKHTAQRELMQKSRVTIRAGTGLQWTVMVAHSGSAQAVGLGGQDVVEITDSLTTATADWRNVTCNYATIGQELSMNAEPARIVDEIRARRLAALISLAELMENLFWGPPVGASDTVSPYGVNTWIVKNATQGFNGGAPSGFTSIGLNPTTYPRWSNWTDQYTNVTNDDFIRRARKMATFTDFEPPVQGMPLTGTGGGMGYYTNYGVYGPLEEALTGQNENLGQDIASMDGKPVFRRTPVTWVPRLEADTTNPFFQIDWSYFGTMVLSGWWLKETHIPVYPGQHTVAATFMDSTFNWVAKNRRCHGVMATGTTYPG